METKLRGSRHDNANRRRLKKIDKTLKLESKANAIKLYEDE